MMIARLEEVVDLSFGGKAYGLSLLAQNGFCVPETYCILPIDEVEGIDEILRQNLLSVLGEKSEYHLAVRSSSTNEDLSSESKAGHFLTIIDRFDMDGLIASIKKVAQSGDDMGIVLQEAIDSEVSGVFFTSHPLSYSRKKGLLSYTEGMGEKLVSGMAAGCDVEVDFLNFDDERFIEIVEKTKELEAKLGYPLDVEWCIFKGKTYYLQCRPVASITSIESGVYKVESKQPLPEVIKSHDKVQLRLEAEKNGIFVSDAYVSVCNHSQKTAADIECNIEASSFCKGYSAVMVYPRQLSDKVIRSFVGNDDNIRQCIGQCYRYGIRSYPEHESLQGCLDSFHNSAADEYWVSGVIIQEVFDAIYTGIAQRVDDGFVVEITRGHFLTKGNVVTSQYHVKDRKILSKREAHQQVSYRIVQGHVVECECYDEYRNLVSLEDSQILEIIDAFSSVIEKGDRVAEFGLVQDRFDLIPYLIDFVDSEKNSALVGTDISDGIVSRGKRIGTIKIIEVDDEGFNLHFHDKHEKKDTISEDIIFVCRTPSISLLDVIAKYDNDKISFVFAEGSVLCHLAVVLREKGIPAIFSDIDGIEKGKYVLDAETTGLKGRERLHRV